MNTSDLGMISQANWILVLIPEIQKCHCLMTGGENMRKTDEANLVQTGDLHCSRNRTLKLLFQFRLYFETQ